MVVPVVGVVEELAAQSVPGEVLLQPAAQLGPGGEERVGRSGTTSPTVIRRAAGERLGHHPGHRVGRAVDRPSDQPDVVVDAGQVGEQDPAAACWSGASSA